MNEVDLLLDREVIYKPCARYRPCTSGKRTLVTHDDVIQSSDAGCCTGRELVGLHGGVTGLGRTGEAVPARLACLWGLCVIAELLECLGFEFVRKAGAFCSGA